MGGRVFFIDLLPLLQWGVLAEGSLLVVEFIPEQVLALVSEAVVDNLLHTVRCIQQCVLFTRDAGDSSNSSQILLFILVIFGLVQLHHFSEQVEEDCALCTVSPIQVPKDLIQGCEVFSGRLVHRIYQEPTDDVKPDLVTGIEFSLAAPM